LVRATDYCGVKSCLLNDNNIQHCTFCINGR
jgi:hypothetical protein